MDFGFPLNQPPTFFFSGILLSRKPPEDQGSPTAKKVSEKKDGEWGIIP